MLLTPELVQKILWVHSYFISEISQQPDCLVWFSSSFTECLCCHLIPHQNEHFILLGDLCLPHLLLLILKQAKVVCQTSVPFANPLKGGRGCLMSPPVWNIRAVIWFPFPIPSLVFLPSLAFSVLSFFCQWTILLTFFQKALQYFFVKT